MIETSRFSQSSKHGDVFRCVVDAEGENFDVHLDPRQYLLMSCCDLCKNKRSSRAKNTNLALLLQDEVATADRKTTVKLLLQEQAPPCNAPPHLYETDFPAWLAARKIQWGHLLRQKNPSLTARKTKQIPSRPSINMFPDTPSGTIDCGVEGHSLNWCPCSFLEMKPPSIRRPTHRRPMPGVVPGSWIDKTCLMGEIGSAALPLVSMLFWLQKEAQAESREEQRMLHFCFEADARDIHRTGALKAQASPIPRGRTAKACFKCGTSSLISMCDGFLTLRKHFITRYNRGKSLPKHRTMGRLIAVLEKVAPVGAPRLPFTNLFRPCKTGYRSEEDVGTEHLCFWILGGFDYTSMYAEPSHPDGTAVYLAQKLRVWARLAEMKCVREAYSRTQRAVKGAGPHLAVLAKDGRKLCHSHYVFMRESTKGGVDLHLQLLPLWDSGLNYTLKALHKAYHGERFQAFYFEPNPEKTYFLTGQHSEGSLEQTGKLDELHYEKMEDALVYMGPVLDDRNDNDVALPSILRSSDPASHHHGGPPTPVPAYQSPTHLPAPSPNVAATGKEIQRIQQLVRLTAARNAPPFHHASYHRLEVVHELDVWRGEVQKHLNVVQEGTPYTGVCGWWGASKGLGIHDARVLISDVKNLADENNDVRVSNSCAKALRHFEGTDATVIDVGAYLSDTAVTFMAEAYGVGVLIVRPSARWHFMTPKGSFCITSLLELKEIARPGSFDLILGHDGGDDIAGTAGTHWDVWMPTSPNVVPPPMKGILGPHLDPDKWISLTKANREAIALTKQRRETTHWDQNCSDVVSYSQLMMSESCTHDDDHGYGGDECYGAGGDDTWSDEDDDAGGDDKEDDDCAHFHRAWSALSHEEKCAQFQCAVSCSVQSGNPKLAKLTTSERKKIQRQNKRKKNDQNPVLKAERLRKQRQSTQKHRSKKQKSNEAQKM